MTATLPPGDTGARILGIEGLRAICVLLVLVFHVDPDWLPSGYLGVDAFFGISGFVITRLLVREVRLGKFSYGSFYRRRFVRLLPALMVTIILTIVLFSRLYGASDLRALSASAVASALSVGNWYFFADAGYFSTDNVFKPLLHTWSLGVEEQYYLIWPWLVVFLLARGWMQVRLLAGAAFALFLITVAVVAVDSDLAFYGTPFRMHQFLIGGAFALLAERPSPRLPMVRGLVAAAALGMIALAIPAYGSGIMQTQAQLVMAALVSGSCWMLAVTERAGVVSALGHPSFVYIGARSYTIYLMHWPVALIAVALFGIPDVQPIWVKAVVMAAGIAAGSLLSETIERPLRLHKQSRSRLPLTLTCALTGLAIAGGVAGFVTATPSAPMTPLGLDETLPTLSKLRTIKSNAVPKGRCAIKFPKDADRVDLASCVSDTEPNILVVGDSLSSGVAIGLMRRFSNINFIRIYHAGCPPYFSDDEKVLGRMTENLESCRHQSGFIWHAVLAQIRSASDIDGLILAGNWNADQLRFAAALDVANNLVDLPYPIAVAGVRVHLRESALRLYELGSIGPEKAPDAQFFLPVEGYGHRQIELNRRMGEVVSKLSNVTYIDVHGAMCGEICPLFVDGALIYQDAAHLTLEGSDYLASTGAFDRFVKRIARKTR